MAKFIGFIPAHCLLSNLQSVHINLGGKHDVVDSIGAQPGQFHRLC
jgi:hypothetical protein